MIHHRIAIVVSSVWGTGASTNPATRAGHPHEGPLAQVEPDGTGWQANPTACGRTVTRAGEQHLMSGAYGWHGAWSRSCLSSRLVQCCGAAWGPCRPTRFVYASFMRSLQL